MSRGYRDEDGFDEEGFEPVECDHQVICVHESGGGGLKCRVLGTSKVMWM